VRPGNRRFDAWEVLLVAALAGVAGLSIGSRREAVTARPVWIIDGASQARLEAKYGSERYSAGLEEYLIREFFRDERDGVFVDVGAYDAKQGSNTYRLERDFGWSGLAIDADADVAASYASRPRSRFVLAFVDAADSGEATFFSGDGGASSGTKAFTEQFGALRGSRAVPRRALASILREHGVNRIDFMSMDIELSEPAALGSFPIGEYSPRLVCVEAHPQTRQWLLDYFARNGYVVVGDFLQADSLNLWFKPLS
jgi:hypothetical protein